MAFEDRSSPNTTNEATTTLNSPNSPESSRTSPYTCMTIQNHKVSIPSTSPNISADEPASFFRITTFALNDERKDSPISFRSNSPTESVASRSSPSPTASQQQQQDDNSSRPAQPAIMQTIKYSIRNILQPDFGKNAILRTKSPSPNKTKTITNTTKLISFKPYENKVISNNDVNLNVKINGAVAPLGGLCQTVSQIGTNTNHQQNNSGVRPKTPTSKPTTPLPNPEDVKKDDGNVPTLWPAWVYCTRYSDRPSSGPRSRRIKKPSKPTGEDKRPRTAFSSAQLARLKHEFNENRYLTERRRQQLSAELGLNEAQIKIWFQNKRAKIKKSSGQKNPLALQLMAQGLYNHSTVPCDEDDMPLST